ncbi:MAG: hypothetical protein ACTSXZ_02575 [Alphaproteobacteria bacterium]
MGGQATPETRTQPVLRLRAVNDNDVSLGRLLRVIGRAATRPLMLLAALAIAALAFLI